MPNASLRPGYEPGDRAVINAPDNPLVHGQPCVVRAVFEHCYHVSWAGPNNDGRGTYRALASELTPAASTNGNHSVHKPTLSAAQARQAGYTTDPCGQCGGFRVRANGACTVCDDCGKQGGCG